MRRCCCTVQWLEAVVPAHRTYPRGWQVEDNQSFLGYPCLIKSETALQGGRREKPEGSFRLCQIARILSCSPTPVKGWGERGHKSRLAIHSWTTPNGDAQSLVRHMGERFPFTVLREWRLEDRCPQCIRAGLARKSSDWHGESPVGWDI